MRSAILGWMRVGGVVVAASGLMAPAVLAWCEIDTEWQDVDGDGAVDADPPLWFGTTYRFVVKDNIQDWDDAIDGMSLSADPSAHNYYRNVVGHLVDSAAQSWNRTGRSPIKLAFAGWDAQAGFDEYDQTSVIVVDRSCTDGFGYAPFPGTPGTPRRDSCDIQICIDGRTLDAVADSEGIEPYYNFWRGLRHEMGHCLGLSHPCQSGTPGGSAATCRDRNQRTNLSQIDAVSGSGLVDGETFAIRDGTGNPTVTFEFNSVGGVGAGRIPIPFSVSHDRTQVRDSIVAAINSVGANLRVAARIRPTFSHSVFNESEVPESTQIVSESISDPLFKVSLKGGGNDWTDCYQGPLMNHPASDQPQGEDVEALQELLRGDQDAATGTDHFGPYQTPTSRMPRREIWLSRTSRLSSGGYSGWQNTNTTLNSAYLPRIDCRKGSNQAVDCVMVRSWDGVQLRVNPINAAAGGGTPSVGPNIYVNHAFTVRTPDVAMSHDESPGAYEAMAVVAPTMPPDELVCADESDCPAGWICDAGFCAIECLDDNDCYSAPGTSHLLTNANETCHDFGGGIRRCVATSNQPGDYRLAYNRMRPIVVHRFEDLAGVTVHTQDTLPDDLVTGQDPRIAYVRSFGSTSGCPTNCANGTKLDKGRYLVLASQLDRTPALYLSDESGSVGSFTRLSEAAPQQGLTRFERRTFEEGFDIHCPTHTNTAGQTEDPDGNGANAVDRRCWVVFGQHDNLDHTDGTLENEKGMTPDGRPSQCVLEFGFDKSNIYSYRLVACANEYAGNGVGIEKSNSFSLTDYGTGVGAGQVGLNERRWLVTASLANPHVNSNSTSNTKWRLWNHNPGTQFFDVGDIDQWAITSSIDAITCSRMGDGDGPMSYFGGTSTEYCEDCQRFIAIRWGAHVASDTPAALCY